MGSMQNEYDAERGQDQTSDARIVVSPRLSLPSVPTRPLAKVRDIVFDSTRPIATVKQVALRPAQILDTNREYSSGPIMLNLPSRPGNTDTQRPVRAERRTTDSLRPVTPIPIDPNRMPVQEMQPSQPLTQQKAEPSQAAEEQKSGSVRRLKRLRRVPELRQMMATECGAACLAMIMSYYGRETRIAEVQERCCVGRDGLTARSIVKAARQYGLRVRAVSVKQNDFSAVALPAVVHWEFNHFVVVERWSKRHVDLVDPAVGRRRLTHDEFEEGFTGITMMLEPGLQFEQKAPPRTLSLWTYTRSMLTVKGIVVQVIMASFLLQVLGLGIPLLTAVIIDNIIPANNVHLLLLLGIGAVLLVITQSITSLFRALLLIYLQTRIDAQMMLNFFEHLLSLPYRFFQLRMNGDILSRVESNTAIRNLLTSQMVSTLLDSSTVIVYFVVLVWQSHLIAGIAVGVGIFQVSLLLLTAPAVRRLTQRDLAAQGKAQGYLNEALSGIATIKAAGAEHRAFDRWTNLFFDQMNTSVRRNYLLSVIGVILELLHTLSPLMLLWVGAMQVIEGHMEIGTMLALNTLAALFLTPLSSLATGGQKIQIAQAHFERLADVLEAEPEQDLQQVHTPPRLTGQVEVRDVNFQYAPGTPMILQGINVQIRPGQRVALVGRTGSGKSTLGKLLIGLITPTDGTILYDGIPLDTLNYREVRSQFGVVLQEASIFSGSIRENIAFNNPYMSMEEVVQSAKLAAIHEDIEKMPMRYETVVSEGGSAFSGGQRQRLALARALAHQPAILLLDEATSALDVATERAVEQNLDRFTCTQIVIAHRLSTIRNADVILVLDEGSILEYGTHEMLLRRNGFYARLIQTQLENGEIEAA